MRASLCAQALSATPVTTLPSFCGWSALAEASTRTSRSRIIWCVLLPFRSYLPVKGHSSSLRVHLPLLLPFSICQLPGRPYSGRSSRLQIWLSSQTPRVEHFLRCCSSYRVSKSLALKPSFFRADRKGLEHFRQGGSGEMQKGSLCSCNVLRPRRSSIAAAETRRHRLFGSSETLFDEGSPVRGEERAWKSYGRHSPTCYSETGQ